MSSKFIVSAIAGLILSINVANAATVLAVGFTVFGSIDSGQAVTIDVKAAKGTIRCQLLSQNQAKFYWNSGGIGVTSASIPQSEFITFKNKELTIEYNKSGAFILGNAGVGVKDVSATVRYSCFLE